MGGHRREPCPKTAWPCSHIPDDRRAPAGATPGSFQPRRPTRADAMEARRPETQMVAVHLPCCMVYHARMHGC